MKKPDKWNIFTSPKWTFCTESYPDKWKWDDPTQMSFKGLRISCIEWWNNVNVIQSALQPCLARSFVLGQGMFSTPFPLSKGHFPWQQGRFLSDIYMRKVLFELENVLFAFGKCPFKVEMLYNWSTLAVLRFRAKIERKLVHISKNRISEKTG